METKIGVLMIRGAGKSGFDAQVKFTKKINKRLSNSGIDTNNIIYEHVDWYGPTQKFQEKLWNRIKQNRKKLASLWLREFVLYLVSDMVAYTGIPGRDSDTYQKTHELIFESIKKLEAKLPWDAPLVIIAASLGTSLINNYIWDRQKLSDDDPWINTPFQRFETLTGFFLFGNNIPLFITGYDPDDWKPVKFPSDKLATDLKTLAKWVNYYDRHDPLGFPMKDINQYFKGSAMIDEEINVGNPLFSWNIGSHLSYWKSKKLARKNAEYLTMIYQKKA